MATMYIRPFGCQILVRFLNVDKEEIIQKIYVYVISMIKDNVHYYIILVITISSRPASPYRKKNKIVTYLLQTCQTML